MTPLEFIKALRAEERLRESSKHVKERAAFIRDVLPYLGPAFLVSVGYMDPGNWVTDLEAGSRF